MSGIAEVVLSVFDIERAARPMVELGGYRRVDLPGVPDGQLAAWAAPAGCAARQALLLPPEGERGALRLVAFDGVEQALIRPSQRAWDTGGIFDVDVFSRDVRALHRGLQRRGWTAFGEPVDYVLGDFDVTQVVAQGPDGLVLAIIEPHTPPLFDVGPFAAMSRVFNSSQIVRDLDAALGFYRDVLGWSPLAVFTVDDGVEPGADVLGLPMPFAKSAKRRIAIVHPEGLNDGSIELIELVGWKGRDYAERAVAPNVGLLSLRIPVASAEGHADAIRARGATLLAPPRRVEMAPFGEVALFSIRAPDGAILEFFETTGTTEGSA